ncbi:hypothetical protein FHX49_000633 [Microbacterium endophyticum]|uniref:Uncharacterized protein n=1 Tax=Microbacterium endophyticum TaxID=1526412 RepID=A0A7W4V1F2_9MICO|nr:hypothetical protein [Microbacterium endophyticum]MBB2975092.1 hypothetical protein [Microbacterium endophyticum]NIK37368.1 hypothetical protein [Microbacterium endophyticum]
MEIVALTGEGLFFELLFELCGGDPKELTAVVVGELCGDLVKQRKVRLFDG